ncbi:uncharacterized protein [Hetaerina americana]|uniref:uncharacterized protein n=1 Tax=Hetaerina americana TaxID=62018 RepID=UPI003A7F1B36
MWDLLAADWKTLSATFINRLRIFPVSFRVDLLRVTVVLGAGKRRSPRPRKNADRTAPLISGADQRVDGVDAFSHCAAEGIMSGKYRQQFPKKKDTLWQSRHRQGPRKGGGRPRNVMN